MTGGDRGAPRTSDLPETTPARPLKPRKRLFIALSIVMAIWIISLIVMYFTTVRPYRHSRAHGTQEKDVR